MTRRDTHWLRFSSASLFAVCIAACSKTDGSVAAAGTSAASAELLDAGGKKIGTARLRQTANGVEIEMQVTGLAPGVHALHIHENGDCHAPGADGKSFSAAGGHFNPFGKKHGLDNPEGPHAGDLPNFTAGADGSASVRVEAKLVTLEPGKPNSLLKPGGTCLVIHAKADDGKTDPSGDSGDRVACGVITRK